MATAIGETISLNDIDTDIEPAVPDNLKSNHSPNPRTLLLCFDGISDWSGQSEASSVSMVKFFRLLKIDDSKEQLVYYQSSGIDQAVSPNTRIAANRVLSGYEFLMQNYKPGDKICLFGLFSGAHIARALAGMLHKVGLLPSINHQQLQFAYKMYTRTDIVGWRESTAFKKTFSNDVRVEFVGVWYAVDSSGAVSRSYANLPFTPSNTAVRTLRLALSYDERRSVKSTANHNSQLTNFEKSPGRQGPNKDVSLWGKDRDRDPAPGEMDVKRAWFANSHHHRGSSGGSDDKSSPGLVPLRWMVRECLRANAGIRFSAEQLKDIGVDYSTRTGL